MLADELYRLRGANDYADIRRSWFRPSSTRHERSDRTGAFKKRDRPVACVPAIAKATKEASPAGRRERRCRLEAQNRWSAVLAAEPVTGERRAALKKKEGSAMRLGADAQDDTQPCDLMSR